MLHCKGCCGLVRTSYRIDGSRKAPTTALCRFVNQLDTAQTVYVEQGYNAKCSVDNSIIILDHGGIIMVCVGIDVAKDKHDCFILSSEGEVLADVFTISNNRDGFEILLQRVQSCSCPTDKIKVGLGECKIKCVNYR